MMRSTPLFCACLALCFQSIPAHAQIFANPEPESIHFGSDNKQLSAVLDLQYQMQLLKRLIEHERAVNQMVQSSIDIGMNDPVINAPERELCAQVPANLPCADAYSDLYEDFAGNAPNPIITQVEAAPPILQNADIPNLAAKALPVEAPPPVQVAFENLFWTDITCMGMKCSAVISPNPGDPMARYRVVVGEKLPDGSLIERISAAGVSVKRNGEVIALEPAPQA